VLYRSFILDSGATAHVCNNLTRFKQFRATGPQDFLFAGQQTIPIIGFSVVQITVKCPGEPQGIRTIDFTDTCFVPAFHTSVVSLRRFIKHNVHWQTESCKLTFKGDTFALTPIVFDQWVLEYNPLAEEATFAVT
jgi:hypothetical protein